MGKVFMSGIAPNLVAPVSYKATFADNDWATIIKACQKNKVPETWTVGSQKTMTINGTDYAIDIIGKNHDTYSDGSGTAPLTFQMHDCYSIRYKMHTTAQNNGGWEKCAMRTTYLPAIMGLMPSEVQAGIKEVNKLTSAGSPNYGTKITTSDKLFLLAESEIHGPTWDSASGEGTQYAYYAAGNSKIKRVNGSAWQWWTRSPYINDSSPYETTSESGNYSRYAANNEIGVSFAFCF